MRFRITLVIVLIYYHFTFGQRSCESSNRCSGARRFGDHRCYMPGEIMRYPRYCSKFRCRKIGGMFMPAVEEIGCIYNGNCYNNGETVFRMRRGKCLLLTCTVIGVRWKFRSERVHCNEV